MKRKAILWSVFIGGITYVVIAVTVNLVAKESSIETAQLKKLSCSEIQKKIDELGPLTFDKLPVEIKRPIIRREIACNLHGKNWSMIDGNLQYKTDHTTIGDERSMVEDFK